MARKSKGVRLLGLTALAVVAAAIGSTLWVWNGLFRPLPAPAGPVRETVESGHHAGRILERLEAVGVLADARLARLYLIHRLGDPPLKAGEYRFPGGETAPEVLDRLIRGEVVTHPVTIPEGLTLEETAEVLVANGFGETHALLRTMRDSTPIRDLDPQAEDLEGYLFPETYHFAESTSSEAIVAALVETFHDRWEKVATRTVESDRTPREVVTLASIVEKEARLDEERPIIAGVYTNRLRRGIALYADPTIIFALKRQGRWDGNLRKRDLEMDSPFNTYRVRGLPPSPICSPGAAALAAAASPADVSYLYFVSRNDGSHVFAETLREHNHNVERWQRRYWREKRAEEAAEAQD